VEFDDRKISRDEWIKSVDTMKEIGNSWAGFVKLKTASEEDFDKMDLDGQGSVLLIEFCKWIKQGEIEAGTDLGKDLKIGDENKKIE